MTFKPGDRVIRTGYSISGIKSGEIYTVRKVSTNGLEIALKELHPEQWFNAGYFELHLAQPAIGTIVTVEGGKDEWEVVGTTDGGYAHVKRGSLTVGVPFQNIAVVRTPPRYYENAPGGPKIGDVFRVGQDIVFVLKGYYAYPNEGFRYDLGSGYSHSANSKDSYTRTLLFRDGAPWS